MNNNINELNKLEEQILQTQQLLEQTGKNDSLVSSLRSQRNFFTILSLLFLLGLIFLFIYNNKKTTPIDLMDNNEVSLVNNDSLSIYKSAYFNSLNISDVSSTKTSLDNEKIIYNVQIGAFKDFQLTSDGLINLSEFKSDGYNKFGIGNYKTYAEAKILKDSLIKLGFKDCFLSAKSYGKQIDIIEALALSNEPEFLEQ